MNLPIRRKQRMHCGVVHLMSYPSDAVKTYPIIKKAMLNVNRIKTDNFVPPISTRTT